MDTELGIVIDVSLGQSEKASLPIDLTEFPIERCSIPVHDEKAYRSIEVTELGISTEVKLVKPENIRFGILTTFLPIVNVLTLGQ